MSGKIMGMVWDLQLPANKLLVLLAMADHADHEGKNIFPSMPLIAWKTGYSERQVIRIVASLVKDGLLTRSVRIGTTNMYTVNLKAGVKKPPFEAKQNVTTDKMSGDKMSGDKMSGDKMSALQDTNKNPPVNEGGDILSVVTQLCQGGGDIAVSPEPSINHKNKKDSAAAAATAPADRPLVFQLFEDAIGTLITQMMADELKLLASEFPQDWLEQAFRETALAGARSVKYTRAILERWKREGKPAVSLPVGVSKNATSETPKDATLKALVDAEFAALPESPIDTYMPASPQPEREHAWRVGGRRVIAKRNVEAQLNGGTA